ncbi:putative phosphatidate cytidylyltransferase, partial [Ascoidea rubescens DSM 1968]
LANPDNSIDHILKKILFSFSSPIDYSFAYGSGVIKQSNYDKFKKKPQIDLIFATNYPKTFHSSNLKENYNHYSFLKYFGADFLLFFQKIGAHVYFNPYVLIDNHQIKYGIISIENLIDDLVNWENFYMAGRLQKPVKTLIEDPRLRFANQLNLYNALNLSLLLLNSQNNNNSNQFSTWELFNKIASLSYSGDIRMKIGGENPHKVSNIVSAQFHHFTNLYKPFIEISKDEQFILPLNKSNETYQFNNNPIITQSSKGILTAGLSKSISYALEKRNKAKSS